MWFIFWGKRGETNHKNKQIICIEKMVTAMGEKGAETGRLNVPTPRRVNG